MYDRVTVKAQARERLRIYRGSSIGVLLLYAVLVYATSYVTRGVSNILLTPPLLVGLNAYFLATWREKDPKVGMLFDGFNRFFRVLGGILWQYLWTFIWSLPYAICYALLTTTYSLGLMLLLMAALLAFTVVYINKLLAYSFVPYLLADYPQLTPRQALQSSKAITYGYRPDMFAMEMSFLGWLLLSVVTLGIAYIVFVGPYMQLSYAGMYEEMLADAKKREVILPDPPPEA